MAIPLPRLSIMSILDYMALAAGLAAGFAVLNPIAGQIQSRLAKGGGSE